MCVSLTRSALTRVALLLAVMCLAASWSCSGPAKPTATPATDSPAFDPLTPQVLWGEMKPVVSVKELMKYSIDPISDYVFDAVGTEMTKDGTVERVPKTDEDWDKIQTGAVSLAESIYLLKVPRPLTPPGDLNNSQGPDAVELSPEAIKAKIEKDPAEWNARIEALRNASLAVMDVVKKRDPQGMWDASENLDEACEACHRSYWYPGENAEFYKRLGERLDRIK